MTDDLEWAQPLDDPTRPERPPKRHRHIWIAFSTPATGPDRGVTVHHDPPKCLLCDKAQNAAASRRGRTNKNRGNRIQRQRIEALGGKNLSGNNENLDGIGLRFRYESKSGGSFPERPWRWLKGIPLVAGQIGVLIITDTPGAGHRARSAVLVDYDDWLDLHQEVVELNEEKAGG